MPTLIELTASIVSSHVSNIQISSDEMLRELQTVYSALQALESGGMPQTEQPRQLTIKQAFKKDEVICMICGKGFKTLKRHLARAHGLKPGQYRKQFNVPSTQPLVAKSYSESRRQAAHERGLGDVLTRAREKKAAGRKVNLPMKTSKAAAPMKTAKAAVPAVKAKAAVPMKVVKGAVPMLKSKAALPAKVFGKTQK
jgi:predicted transcriptional regulator